MFFDRLIRNIVIFLIGFILAINVYYWSVAIQFGTQDTFEYVGFVAFFRNFERMPKFEFFVDSLNDLLKVFTEWSSWKTALSIVTFGLYNIGEFTVMISQTIICIVIDIFRYIAWLFGFIGVQFDTPILEQ